MTSMWKRLMVAGVIASTAATGLLITDSSADADTIAQFSVDSKTYRNGLNGLERGPNLSKAEAGTVQISTVKGGGGTYIKVQVRGRKAIKNCTLIAQGLPVDSNRYEYLKENALDAAGNADVTFGPFTDAADASFGGVCTGDYLGARSNASLTDPNEVRITLRGAATNSGAVQPGTPSPGAGTPPERSTSPRNTPLSYKDCAPLTADALTEGQVFSDPVTGSIALAMKAVCAQVAYFSGDEKLQLELICEAFIDASTVLIPAPKVRGQSLEVTPEFARAASWVSDQWPAFKKAVNDAKCKGRQDYPSYSGRGGGGW